VLDFGLPWCANDWNTMRTPDLGARMSSGRGFVADQALGHGVVSRVVSRVAA
jgi:hypothetical protein